MYFTLYLFIYLFIRLYSAPHRIVFYPYENNTPLKIELEFTQKKNTGGGGILTPVQVIGKKKHTGEYIGSGMYCCWKLEQRQSSSS